MKELSSAKEIFAEAIELAPAQREAFLRGSCGDDRALLEEVRELIAFHESAAQMLDTPAVVEAAERPGAGVREGPGAVIGRYKLLQIIGEGGFGTVFMAEQREPVVRRIALKIIKAGMDTAQVIARFEAERQALAMMDHPNIAKVLDAGTTDSGRPYFVMELVRGEPITEFCDRGTLTIAQRLEILVQVCSAVQHAHTKGVIHRDLKPSNVLVSEQDGRPLARVIDFGIAKATDHRLTEKTLFTDFRQFIGTPEYMSPEQATGGFDIDTRTDVYSLGVLLYQLLTGSTPFDSRRLRSAAYADVQRIIREVDPPKPSTRLSQSGRTLRSLAAQRRTEPGRLGALVRGELDWIAMKAMEKDRGRRYETASALGEDLRRYLSGEAVGAAPPGAAYRVRKFVRRHRGPVVAGALIGLALVVGMAGTSVGMARARAAHADAVRQAGLARASAETATEQAQRADREAETAHVSERAAEAANALMTTTIQRANRSRQGGRADITVREVMDAAAKDLEEHPGTQDPKVELLLAKTIGEIYRELSLLEPAERMLRISMDRAGKVFGTDSVDYADALSNLGALLKARGDLAGAGDLYGRAIEILGKAGDAGAERLAGVGINAAALAAAQGDLGAAQKELERSIAYYESHSLTGEEYLTALHNLADVVYERGDTAQALKMLRRVVDLERKAYGEGDPRMLETLHGLSVVQFVSGDPGAEQTIRQELAMARRLYGNDHEEVAHLLQSLGVVLTRKGDLAGAEAALREDLEITRKVFGAGTPRVAAQQAALAGALIQRGSAAEGEALLREATPILIHADETADGKGAGLWQPDTLLAVYELGSLLERRGAWAEAEPLLRNALEAAKKAQKDGGKYEWMREALASALGGVVLLEGADESLSREARTAKFYEAESLVTPAADRLLAIAQKIGPRNRRLMVGAALDRTVRLYTAWQAFEPGRATPLSDWQRRKADFERVAIDGG